MSSSVQITLGERARFVATDEHNLLLVHFDACGLVAKSRPIAPQSEDAGDAGTEHFQEGALDLVGIVGGAVGIGEGLSEPLD
jgi:hypothetical protein